MKDFNTDVLIVGTGIAGLSAALKLAEKNIQVTIITREKKTGDHEYLLGPRWNHLQSKRFK